VVDIAPGKLYDYEVRLATMRRRHSAATPIVSPEMQAADITSRCSMQQKKQRTPASGSARRRVKSANAQPADVVTATEKIATFDERVAAPESSSEEAIRTRAYYLFLERGARAGHELDDWLRAESEIRA
jgi:hypothetical protein